MVDPIAACVDFWETYMFCVALDGRLGMQNCKKKSSLIAQGGDTTFTVPPPCIKLR